LPRECKNRKYNFNDKSFPNKNQKFYICFEIKKKLAMETQQPMENQTNTRQGNTYLKSAMTYGLITGIALVIYTVLLYMTDNYISKNAFLGILQWLILAAGLYYGIKSYRDQYAEGYITYGKSLGLGVLISVFVGVIMGIFTYLLYVVIDPELLEKSLKFAQEEMLKSGLSEEQVEAATKMQRTFSSPIIMLFSSVFSFAFFGTLISLVVSIFTKKDKPMFNQ
jgi:uncharacterized membrane protein YcjF (UPF0283 family)